MIAFLLTEAKAKLVISFLWGSWDSRGRDEFEYKMTRNGLSREHLHDDWMTPREYASRSDQVHYWLGAHPEVTSWISFDDVEVAGDGAIRVSSDDGISLGNYNLACRKFGLRSFMVL